MPMNRLWTVREATIDDSVDIFELHRQVYDEIYDLEKRPDSLWEDDARSWWQWWMLDNPTGKSYSCVAEVKKILSLMMPMLVYGLICVVKKDWLPMGGDG